MTMRRPLHGLCWLLVTLVVLLASRAGAGEDEVQQEAAETFTKAERAYRRGEYRVAAEGFEASAELVPHGAAFYNAAMAWLAAEERSRAADAFAQARRAGNLDPRQEETTLAQLSALRKQLGRIAVGAPAGSMVWLAHVQGADAPVLVHLEPGSYEVRVQFPSGEEPTKRVDVAAGELITLALNPSETPSSPAEPSDEAEAQDESALPVAGFVTAGASVVLAAVAIGLGVAALDARDEFNASGYTDRDAYARADELRTATNVCWVFAGLTAATGAVLLVVAYSDGDDDAEGEQEAGAELRLAPGAVWLTGAW